MADMREDKEHLDSTKRIRLRTILGVIARYRPLVSKQHPINSKTYYKKYRVITAVKKVEKL